MTDSEGPIDEDDRFVGFGRQLLYSGSATAGFLLFFFVWLFFGASKISGPSDEDWYLGLLEVFGVGFGLSLLYFVAVALGWMWRRLDG